MKTLTVGEVARKFRAVIDGVETTQEEILITRNGKPIACLVPECAPQTALELFSDVFCQKDVAADAVIASHE